MRRILLVLSVAALMAAMVVVTAAPAFAKNTFQTDEEGPPYGPGPPASSGAFTTVFHCNSTDVFGTRGAYVIHKNGTTRNNCDEEL